MAALDVAAKAAGLRGVFQCGLGVIKGREHEEVPARCLASSDVPRKYGNVPNRPATLLGASNQWMDNCNKI